MRRTLGYPSRSYGVRYPPMRLVIVLGLWSCLLALAGVLALVWLAHARHFSIDLPDEIYLDARTWPSRSLLHATCVSAMLIGGAVGSVLGVVMWRWGRRFKAAFSAPTRWCC